MPERIPDQKREEIAQAIRDGGTCRGIATQHGVSPSTVRNIAKQHGITDAFARASTEKATRARVADMADRRARLAEQMLDLADRMIQRTGQNYTVYLATKDEIIPVTYNEPPAADTRQLATALGIYLDKHMALVRFDTKEGHNAAATSLADRLLTHLGLTGGPGDGYDDGYPAEDDPLSPEPDDQVDDVDALPMLEAPQ